MLRSPNYWFVYHVLARSRQLTLLRLVIFSLVVKLLSASILFYILVMLSLLVKMIRRI